MKTRPSVILTHRTCARTILSIVGLFLILYNGEVLAQNRIASHVAELRAKGSFKRAFNPFTVAQMPPGSPISKEVSHSTLLDVNESKSEILNTKPDFMEMNVPI